MTRMQRTERKMRQATAFLRRHKIYYTLPLPSHIKIGSSVNFWPSSGKAFVDGDKKCHPERGLRALEAVLRSQGYLSGPSPYTNPYTNPPRSDDHPMEEICVTIDLDEQ